MKGWHYESMRHSLAARGISTRARALVKPHGGPDCREITHMSRWFKTLHHLNEILRSGGLRDCLHIDVYPFGELSVYGGLTTASSLVGIEKVLNYPMSEIILDPDVMLRYNDIIKIDYTPEFFMENMDIAQRVDPRVSDVNERWAKHLAEDFYEEEELVSRNPIVVPSEAILRINIRYGNDTIIPTTAKYEKVVSVEESRQIEKEIEEFVIQKIPKIYHDRIWLINATTGEERTVGWLI